MRTSRRRTAITRKPQGGPSLCLLQWMTILLGVLWISGCQLMSPKVRVEPVTFDHPDEIIRGAGHAEGYWVLADRRVFAVMAWLNAVGYDEEAPGRSMPALRLTVRQKVAENLAAHPEQLDRWRRYYQQRPLGSWQYANFALSLSTDYPFKRVRPNRELTYKWTAYRLAGLPEVLNDFWVAAKLDELWTELRPAYQAEIRRYSPDRTAAEMDFLWGYLRMQRPDHYIVVHIPNLLQRSATASANEFGPYFYSIDGPGSSGGGLNAHEYLHTVVNDLVKNHYRPSAAKLRTYFEAGRDAPICASYQELPNWCAECLVHALDYRVTVRRMNDPKVQTGIDGRVDALTRAGFTLIRPFYEALASFEGSQQPFDQYLTTLLQQLPEYQPPPPSSE